MSKFVKCLMLLCVVCLVGTSVIAAVPFEPLFRIVKIAGDCEVKLAGAGKFVDAMEGKAYAYGTMVRTGRKSSAVIRLSEGNECRVFAKATLTMKEGVTDPKLKILNLTEGKIEFVLDETLSETGNSLNVETATAVCGIVGTEGTAETHQEQGVNVSVFQVKKGSTKLSGQNWDIPEFDAGDSTSISGDAGGSFTRVKTLKGAFDIHYTDSQGNPKVVSTEPDSIIKIWRRIGAGGKVIIVTVIQTDPDGTTHPADVFTEEVPEGADPAAYQVTTGPTSGRDAIRIDENGIITVTTTTTTTTTTYVNSTTPVGRGRS